MTRVRRLLMPLILSGILFALYRFLLGHHFSAGGNDVGETAFGAHLRWLSLLVVVPLIFFFVRLLDLILFDVLMSRRSVAAPQLLREILAVGLYFILISWTVSILLEKDVTGWLTAGTVVAAVLALALQETLGNLFSGIALHLEDTFSVGDVIRSGDHIGVVEGFRWRGTRIRTFNNNLVVLPNSLVARERLEVFPRGNPNARVLSVGLDYNVPPATAIAVLTQAAAHVDGVARDEQCLARVGGFSDSGLVYEIKYFMRRYEDRDRIDSDIRKAVWYALRRHGLTIPYPIRALQRYEPVRHGELHVLPEEMLQRLQEVAILSPLSVELLSEIVTGTSVHSYAKGETILVHGASGDSMFVMHQGSVSIRVPDESETGSHEVAKLGPGEIFGEMALLTGEARAADVVALAEVITFEIGKEALQPIFSAHPELADSICAKVLERREHLDLLRAEREDAQRTVLSRIRAYFGI